MTIVDTSAGHGRKIQDKICPWICKGEKENANLIKYKASNNGA